MNPRSPAQRMVGVAMAVLIPFVLYLAWAQRRPSLTLVDPCRIGEVLRVGGDVYQCVGAETWTPEDPQ